MLLARDKSHRREVHLAQDHWGNLGSDLNMHHDYNYSPGSRHRYQQIARAVTPVLKDIVAHDLTARQREIVRLYFLEDGTEVAVARLLDISQPTVSQHLTGKARDGKKVGGALKKIRKGIHRRAQQEWTPSPGLQILVTYVAVLDGRISRRAAFVALGIV